MDAARQLEARHLDRLSSVAHEDRHVPIESVDGVKDSLHGLALQAQPLRKWISSCWTARGLASSPTSKAVATRCLEIHSHWIDTRRVSRVRQRRLSVGSNPITSTLALTLDSADSKADV